MSLILSKNDFLNKSLLNTDSGVEFVNADTKSISVSAIAKLALTTWSISFNLKKIATTGNTFFTQSGGIALNDTNISSIVAERWYNVVVLKTGEIYYNGTLHHTETAFGNLLNAITTIGAGDFIINNLVVYDKALTGFEVYHHVYLHGGEIRKPLHENIVFHAPLTQKFSHKVIAGDEALSKGLSIGDNMALDISERYNYIKNSVIIAQHGKFVNFSDDEIGVDTNQNVSDSLRGFYENEEYRSIGKRYDSDSKNTDVIASFTKFDYTQPVTYLIDVDLKESGGYQNILSNRDIQPNGIDLLDNALVYYQNNVVACYVIIPSLIDNGRTVIIFTVDGTGTTTGMKAYSVEAEIGTSMGDNLTAPITTTTEELTIGSNPSNVRFANGLIHNIEILNSVKSLSDIQEASAKGTFHNVGATLDSEFLLSVNFNKESSQLTTKPNTPVYTIQAYEDVTPITPILGDGNYVEAKTNLPKISECLLIEGQKYVSYPTSNLPSDTEDFTLMVSGWIVDTLPSPIGLTNHLEFLLNLADKTVTTDYTGNSTRLSFYSDAKNTKDLNSQYRVTTNSIIETTEDQQYLYFCQIAIVVKKSILKIFINGQLVSENIITSQMNPSAFTTKLFRSGFQNWDTTNNLSNVSELYISQMGYWKRALDGWEVSELYNNSQLGNPLINRGFQNNLEQYFQFQQGSIYKNGAIYYVKNQADILKGTWTSAQANDAIIDSDGTAWTDGELITSPTKIIKTDKLR